MVHHYINDKYTITITITESLDIYIYKRVIPIFQIAAIRKITKGISPLTSSLWYLELLLIVFFLAIYIYYYHQLYIPIIFPSYVNLNKHQTSTIPIIFGSLHSETLFLLRLEPPRGCMRASWSCISPQTRGEVHRELGAPGGHGFSIQRWIVVGRRIHLWMEKMDKMWVQALRIFGA
jgi:hypothetical protein